MWLNHVDFQASDCTLELAGLDERVSSDIRGLSLHLDNVTMDYKAKKDDHQITPVARRRAGSVSNELDENLLNAIPSAEAPESATVAYTDDRRLAIHTKGLEAFIMESLNTTESKPFLSIARSEVALTTSSDSHALLLHVNSAISLSLIHISEPTRPY